MKCQSQRESAPAFNLTVILTLMCEWTSEICLAPSDTFPVPTPMCHNDLNSNILICSMLVRYAFLDYHIFPPLLNYFTIAFPILFPSSYHWGSLLHLRQFSHCTHSSSSPLLDGSFSASALFALAWERVQRCTGHLHWLVSVQVCGSPPLASCLGLILPSRKTGGGDGRPAGMWRKRWMNTTNNLLKRASCRLVTCLLPNDTTKGQQQLQYTWIHILYMYTHIIHIYICIYSPYTVLYCFILLGRQSR